MRTFCACLFLLGIVALAVSAAGDGWISGGALRGERSPEVGVVSSTSQYIRLRGDFPGVSWEMLSAKGGDFVQLTIPDGGHTTDIGKPRMPVVRRFIEVPLGARFEVRVLSERSTVFRLEDLGITQPILPVQPPVPKIEGAWEKMIFELDEDFYQKDSFYPEGLVAIKEAGELRGHRLLLVELYPVSYNPRRGELRVLSQIEVRVDLSGSDMGRTLEKLRRYRSSLFDRLCEGLITNYGWLEGMLDSPPPLPIGYLIITHDDFFSEVQPLADWKQKKGFHVTVARTSETGPTNTEIKAYIEDAYNTWPIPPQFVMLVGDVAQVPCWPGIGDRFCDLYYVTITVPDYFPDIWIGRLPAQTTGHAAAMVEKTVDFERADWSSGTIWAEKAYFIASADGGFHGVAEATHQYSMAICRSYGMTCDSLWLWYGTGTPFSSALNEGRVEAIFSGHGSETGCEAYSAPDILALSNLDMYPWATCFACLTGSYDVSECLGETWVRTADKGAVAFWGSSTLSYWDEDDILQRREYDAYFDSSLTWLAGFTDMAKYALWLHYGGGGMSQEYYEQYNLMGDPSLDLWWDEPADLTVGHPPVFVIGQPEFTVTVDGVSGALENALVCIYTSGFSVFETGYTDAYGEAVLHPDPATAGTLYITVTAHNYRPYEGGVPIISPSGPYPYCLSHSTDDSRGNADGNVNPGESIWMDVTLKNYGGQTAQSVNATLRESDPWVSIIDSLALYGDIPPDSTATSQTPYDYSVAAACTNGHRIQFNLEIRDVNDSVWVCPINIRVGSPFLVYRSHTVDDAGQPHPNGGLDPGEMGWLEVEIENTGFGNAYGVVGFLSTADTLVTVSDSRGAYGDILGGNRATNSVDRFVVVADPFAPWGYEMEFSLRLTGLYGFSQTVNFTLKLGEAGGGYTGPDSYGYYCYDNTDFQFTECPSYDWLGIAPPGPGTIIPEISDEDEACATRTLPFTFKYYGSDETLISISSNGWMSFESVSDPYYNNHPIPDPGGPPAMVAPFWDDLNPLSHGDIYEYYDAAAHTYILEWKEVAHWSNPTAWESFQVVLYDPVYEPTVTGDGEIICQYERVDNSTGCTVGIENYTETDGIEYLYNGSYDPNAAPLQVGRAVKFTTDPPVQVQGPCVYYEQHTIYDPAPGGNNNSILDPGETVEMVVVLENHGTQDATNVQGVLRTQDPDVTLQDSTGAFGDIPVLGQGDNDADRFSFAVTDPVQDEVIEFEVLLTADGGYQTTVLFNVYVGFVGVEELSSQVLPQIFGLSQNYPNPFGRSTTISYTLPSAVGGRLTAVNLSVYDVSGRLVRTLVDGDNKPGFYSVTWDGRDSSGSAVANGVYFYRLEGRHIGGKDGGQAVGLTSTKKLVVLR